MGIAGACVRERERGAIWFNQTDSVGLTTGPDQWAPPDGLVAI
jgi:hypothetical protein